MGAEDYSDRDAAIAELGEEEYERQNANAREALKALLNAASGHPIGAVKNAAMVLGIACAHVDGTELESFVDSTRVAWKSSIVDDLSTLFRTPADNDN